jgi:hypothetical protein
MIVSMFLVYMIYDIGIPCCVAATEDMHVEPMNLSGDPTCLDCSVGNLLSVVNLRRSQLDLFASLFLGIIDLNLKHRKRPLEVFGCLRA